MTREGRANLLLSRGQMTVINAFLFIFWIKLACVSSLLQILIPRVVIRRDKYKPTHTANISTYCVKIEKTHFYLQFCLCVALLALLILAQTQWRL